MVWLEMPSVVSVTRRNCSDRLPARAAIQTPRMTVASISAKAGFVEPLSLAPSFSPRPSFEPPSPP